MQLRNGHHESPEFDPQKDQQAAGNRRRPRKTDVTEARAKAQRAKLDAQADARQGLVEEETLRAKPDKKTTRQEARARQRTIAGLIEAYIQDHEGGNHSQKTIEWHRTALGLMQKHFEEELALTQIEDVEGPDISGWFSAMRKMPGAHGKIRSERTVQTYARSARAFFHWLIYRGTLTVNPFDRVVFPKVGKPLIETISDEEFEKLLYACAPTNETSTIAERAAVRNKAILWLLYDTGIRVSELTNLRIDDLDRKHSVITVLGKGSKERRIAVGQNCLRNLLYYLDKHRPSEEELAEWGSAGEDHFFLSETRQPLTKNGVELLFKRLKERAGIASKRISPHILRHTFAINYLIHSNDPFSLQELLGHEDMATVRNYMHMNDKTIQDQKRKYSPGDHVPMRLPAPRETRRRGFQTKDQRKRK